MALKQKRSVNFTSDEPMALIELIDGHKTVIEDKKNDAYANKRKQAAWNDVTTKIKALFPERPITSTKELKELWRRIVALQVLPLDALGECVGHAALQRRRLHLVWWTETAHRS